MTYRDPNLTEADAMTAIDASANDMIRAALDARRDLLEVGIADSHPLCVMYDDIAARLVYVRKNRRLVANYVTLNGQEL